MHTTASIFRVDFTLDAPTPYWLDGSIAAAGAGFLGDTGARLELRRSTGEPLHQVELADDDGCFEQACSDLGSLALDEAGVLDAGSYVLEAELTGQTDVLISLSTQTAVANGHTGAFGVDLQLGAQVPLLPGAGVALLALGLVGAGMHVRRVAPVPRHY